MGRKRATSSERAVSVSARAQEVQRLTLALMEQAAGVEYYAARLRYLRYQFLKADHWSVREVEAALHDLEIHVTSLVRLFPRLAGLFRPRTSVRTKLAERVIRRREDQKG